MKQYQITIDDNTDAVLQKAADMAQMSVPEFLQHAGLVYMMNQNRAGADRTSRVREGGRRSVKTSSGKTKFSAEQREELFYSFAQYFHDSLTQYRKEYSWNYHISPESYADWFDAGLYEGETGEDSYRLHALCARALFSAMREGDEKLCYEAVRIAMDWGGTYYNFRIGAAKGNEDAVTSLYEKGELLGLIRRSALAVRERRFLELEYYTAGWSIIWYLLDMDAMVIFSAREACAYNRILQSFKETYGLASVPDNIDLGQLVDRKNRRYIPDVRYVYTLKGKLQMLQSFMKIVSALRQTGDGLTSRLIDEKLFMLGE